MTAYQLIVLRKSDDDDYLKVPQAKAFVDKNEAMKWKIGVEDACKDDVNFIGVEVLELVIVE